MPKRGPKPKSKPEPRSAAGFSDDAAPPYDAAGPSRASHTVELGAGGRLVIPAPMRAALGMKVGDRLTVRLDGDELRVHTYQVGIRRMQERMRRHLPKDAVDDFLKWKRAEAAKEQAELGGDVADE